MSLADRVKERFRARLKRWVDREKAAHGCMTKATKAVAKKVGMSVATIYRIIGRYDFPVKIQAHHYVAAIAHTMEPPKKRRLPFGIFSAEKHKVPVFSKGVEA